MQVQCNDYRKSIDFLVDSEQVVLVTTKSTLAERLRSARQSLGITQHDLNASAGVGAGTVSRIENEGAVSAAADTLQALAKALGVSYSWLAFGEGEMDRARPFPDGERARSSDEPSPFARRLARARLAKGLSSYKLSALAGLSSSHVNKIEKGERHKIAPETVEKLASALGVSSEWLLSGAEGDSANHPPDLDRYPSRARAVQAAHLLGYDERAIAIVRSWYIGDGDTRSEGWWMDRIIEEQQKLGKSGPVDGFLKKSV